MKRRCFRNGPQPGGYSRSPSRVSALRGNFASHTAQWMQNHYFEPGAAAPVQYPGSPVFSHVPSCNMLQAPSVMTVMSNQDDRLSVMSAQTNMSVMTNMSAVQHLTELVRSLFYSCRRRLFSPASFMPQPTSPPWLATYGSLSGGLVPSVMWLLLFYPIYKCICWLLRGLCIPGRRRRPPRHARRMCRPNVLLKSTASSCNFFKTFKLL